MKGKIPDDKVKEDIVLAATDVFVTYGISKVSMHDISSASKMGRSSLYYYFSNKMEVFDAVGEKKMKTVFEICANEASRDASLAENLEKFQIRKLNEVKLLVKQFYLVILDLRQDPSLLFAKMRVLPEDEIVFYDQMLRWAIEKREIKDLSAEDSRFLSETLVTAMGTFELEILLFDRLPNFEKKLSWLTKILYHGLQ